MCCFWKRKKSVLPPVYFSPFGNVKSVTPPLGTPLPDLPGEADVESVGEVSVGGANDDVLGPSLGAAESVPLEYDRTNTTMKATSATTRAAAAIFRRWIRRVRITHSTT